MIEIVNYLKKKMNIYVQDKHNKHATTIIYIPEKKIV